jgi:hypothetical protein
VGTEFRVNTTTSNSQLEPAVTGLANGGWVVSWTDQYGAASNTYDVFLQQYDAAGRQVDGETLVNSYVPSVQQQPAITAMADGGFVVAWSSYVYSSDQNGDGQPDGGNNTYEIHLQRYSNTAPQISPFTVNGQEEAVIVLDAQLFIDSFNDAEGQNLAAIRITTLPAEGTLKVDGVAVFPGQEVSLAELQAGKLSYQGDVDYFGLDQFAWTGSDGVAYAPNPVFSIINLANVNDAPALQAGADDTAAEGTLFDHAITLGDPDPDTHLITVDWGDGSAPTQYSTSDAVFNIWHYFPDNGSYTVTVTANDQAGQGNSVETDSFEVVVSNVAPDLTLSGGATVEQNLPYTLTLGSVYDPGADTVTEYRIDWGDGSPVQVIATGDLPANRELVHTYTSTGNRTISVSLVDEDGTHASVDTQLVQVSAAAEVLTVNAGNDLTVNEGQFFVPAISFVDPTDTDPAGRLYTIDWGDGTSSSGRSFNPAALGVGHTYADDNASYTVTVTVDDDGAQSGSDSFQVTVNNVAPTLNLSGGGSVAEGALYTLAISHSDPGDDTIASYSIDWGDGGPAQTVTAAELATAGGSVTHIYADGAAGGTARTITVNATDEDGTWTQTKALTVNNVAPTIALTGNLTVDEGSTFTLNLGAVTDPGQDTPTSYTISWGDGVVEVVNSLGDYTHVYADGTTNRTITVLVTDEDGQHANAGTHTVTVNNVAPAVVLTGADQTAEGAAYALSLAGSDPAGTADTLSYSIDWGDGSAAQVLTAVQLAALGGSVAHVFADDEDGVVNATGRTITVTVADEDGGSSITTKSVTVNNVAPTAALSGAATVAEAATYTLAVGAVSDPGPDTRSGYAIDWGDGSVQSLTAAEWAAAAGSFSHAYADGAMGGSARLISVSATDEDGTHLLGTQAVTVQNAAPIVVPTGAAATTEGASYVLDLVGSDPAGAADTLSYSIDWGDGSAAQVLTAVQLAALGGSVAHVFADDDDGPLNATDRTITVTVSDEDGGSSTTTKTVTVNNVAPTVALVGAPIVVEDVLYTLDLGAVSDPGDDTVANYAIDWGDGSAPTMLTAAELAALGGSATHVYADPGAYSVVVTLVDEDGIYLGGVLDVLAIPGGGGNTPPLAGDDSYSVQEGYTLTIAAPGLLANDSDADGDAVSAFQFFQPANGTVALTADGSFSYTPNAGFTGTDSFEYLITDGTATDSGTVSIEVVEGSPTPAPDSYSVHAGTVLTIPAPGLLANDTDPNGDPLTAFQFFQPANGTVALTADGSFSYTPNAGFVGLDSFDYVVTDGANSGLATVTIDVTNAAPLAGDDSYSVQEGNTLTIAAPGLLANDSDADGDAVSAFQFFQPANGTVALTADGSFSYTPNAGFTGTDSFEYLITDGTATDSGTVSIEVVEGSPTPAPDSYSVHAGTVLTIPAPGLLANDTDPNGDPLTAFQFFQPANGTVALTADGSFSYTPNAGFVGLDSFDYVVTDGANSGLATVTIDVTNAAPVADDESYAVQTGQVLTITAPGVLDGDTDADGDALSVLSVDLTGLAGTLGSFADGGFIFTPTAGFVGTTSFTYTVSDGLGGSDTATVTIDVTATANTPPQVQDETYTVHAGDVLAVNAAAGLLANDTDADGDTLRVMNFEAPANGSLTVVTDGSFTYTPNAGFVGSEVLTYTVSDGITTRTGELTIVVENEAPVVNDETYSVHAGEVLAVGAAAGLLANDTDADGDTLRVMNFEAPANGSLTVVTDGSFTYTPNAGFVGTEVLTYTVSDGITTRTGELTIVVENEAPVVNDETYSVHAGEVLAVGAAAGLLANDTDADGDTLRVMNFEAPANGSLTVVTDGSFTYTPNAGFVGTEVLSYTVSDGITTRTGELTIVVENEAPVVQDETYSVNAGETLAVNAAAGLLANDTDADGDALRVMNFEAPANGSLTVVTDGSFTYTPNAGFVGSEVLSYTVSDGLTTVSGEFTINVTPVVEPTIIHLGDASGIASPANPYVWAPFWSDADVSITHKAAYANSAEAWTSVLLTGSGSAMLAGGDLNGGDLGVSGRALASSTVAQEISGTEALRFELESPAARATVDLTRLFVADDGNASGFVEAGRLQALDEQGNVVAELSFAADRADGTKTVTLSHAAGFSSLVLTAGAYDGSDFVFGAYAESDGSFAAAPYYDTSWHGSDFLVDSVEFELVPLVGVTPGSGG